MKGWRCPKCGSANVRVRVHAWANLIQTMDRDDGVNENEFTTNIKENHDWNEDSPMDCTACGYEAKTSTFIWTSAPSGTIPVIAEQLA